MLGGVVERAPAVPTPMEVRVGGGGGGGNGTRASAGMVEGHLPKIEADLSFRVVPRGGYPGVGGGQEDEEKSLGDYGLGGPLTEDEVEDEKLEDKEDDSGDDDDAEADENDRCVCVCV